MPVTEITSLRQFQRVNAGPNKIIIYSKASWCRPCETIGPIFEKLAAQHEGKIDFYVFDVDEVADLPEELGIRSMPTFIYLKDGLPRGQVVGANASKLEEFFTKALEDESS
ncbi:hypothetical protein OC846_001854 [Tilletia horrida]|uniref:Thioredoxin n=1 Tax=Tilletia horrida TaxID=155126 RepID=A0AAN6GUL5_9BASI|nr:hypothetical protein OC845_001620 [Tilletia horrida]KAK0554997.1 hypothetical protein OC846_001854 [Tilletia horrida]KAK0568371.1 hypothetical protein OC861_002000 [Tilletia horrida]